MNRIKTTFKSFAYSFKLILESSNILIFIYGALQLISTSIPLLSAFLLKLILDELTAVTPDIGKIISVVVIYGLSLVLLQGVNSASSVINNNITHKAKHLYQTRLCRRLTELPMDIVDSSAGRDMADNVRYTEHATIRQTFNFIRIFTNVYSCVVAFSTLALFSLEFSLLFLIITLPSVIYSEHFAIKAEKLREKTAPDVRKFSYYRWMLTDAWPAKDVRMYDLTDAIKSRYSAEKDAYLNANKALDKKKHTGLILIELLRRSGEIVFTAYVIYKAINGAIGIGDVALYVGFASKISDSFEGLTWLVVDSFYRVCNMMGKVFEFYTIKTVKKDPSRALSEFESVRFDNVYFKYPHTDKYILKGASFTLNKGDKLSIVGINGSGKTTIIKLMLGLYEIESGQILINGYPMEDFDIREVRKLYSVLFQDFAQYPLTLRENVAFSSLDRIKNDEEIEDALKQSGIYDDIMPQLEDGLDSFVSRRFSDRGKQFSKGQWQKIALSRAYFKNSPVIIFDEPSAALDAEAEDRIFRNFEEASSGKTGIMISHRISSARISNKIIVLENGRITEEGNHNELVTRGGLYARLYNLQRDKYTAKEAE